MCRYVPSVLQPLLRRRLIFVTGKGGVGKDDRRARAGAGGSAHRALRTIVADLNGDGDLRERRVRAPNLFRISVDPQSAMEEYLNVKVPGPAGQMLRQSKLFSGLRDGDARHARAALHRQALGARSARAAHARRGRLRPRDRRRARLGARRRRSCARPGRSPRSHASARSRARHRRSRETIADPDFTAVVAVSTAEEMPVNETLQLRDALATGPDPLELEAVILNGLLSRPLHAADAEVLARDWPARSRRRRAVRVALAEHGRARLQRARSSVCAMRSAHRLRDAPLPVRAAARAPAARAAGRGAGAMSATRAGTARGPADLHLRGRRRRRQDDDLGRDRARDGRARAQGRGGDDRPGAAAGQRARARQQLDNEPRLVAPDRLAGLEMSGELWAMMLDPKRTFDDLIDRVAPDARSAPRRSSGTGVYRELSTAVSGSQEFTAIEKLYELAEADYDLLVLDTPPAHNAARVPERAGPADRVPRRRRAADAAAPDRLRDAAAGPRRRAGARRAEAGDRRRPRRRPDDFLHAARRHDRGVQRPRQARRRSCCTRRTRRSCS